MSAKHTGWALEQKLPPAQKITLVVLTDCLNAETGKCMPSQKFIAERVGVSVRTVRSYLADLAEAGLIERIERTHPVSGARLSDGYVILMDAPTPPEESSHPPGSPGLPTPPEEAASPLEPEREPSLFREGEAGARTNGQIRKPVAYKGKRVSKEQAATAERLILAFKAATGKAMRAYTQNGDATPEMKQVIGAIMLRPDVGEERWMRAIRNTVANPPDWIDGDVKLGHVFGARAAEWALDNDGGTSAEAQHTGVGDGYARQRARRIAEGW